MFQIFERMVTKGLPRQFWLMKENKRCSILFHLLVPGGIGACFVEISVLEGYFLVSLSLRP
jgi:hypothetical protein